MTALPASPDPADGIAIRPLADALADRARWHDLVLAAAEPGLFAGPHMLAAAAGTVEPADWRVATVDGRGGRLDALLAFRPQRLPLLVGSRLLDGFWSHYGPRNPPLVRRGAEARLADLVTALAAAGDVLRLHNQWLDGPIADRLAADAVAAGRSLIALDAHPRAMLDAAEPAAEAVGPGLRGDRLRDLRRKLRRLADHGLVAHETVSDPAGLAAAAEAFVRLEAASWRGARGSAIADRPERRAFLDRLVAGLAADGLVEADVLRTGEAIVAVLLVPVAAGTAYTWKIAHDDRLAAASPGVLVAWQATERLLADPAVGLVDSLAVPDHPVMDRIWAGRIRIGTLVVALDPAANAAAARAARLHAGLGEARSLARRWRDRLSRG